VDLYFDTNVFQHLDRRGEVGATADLVAARRARILLSSAHQTEILRIDDPAQRASRVGAVFAFNVRFLPPEAIRLTREFLDEVKRLHPDWVRSRATGLIGSRFTNESRRIWRDLRDRPEDRPQRMDEFEAMQAQVIRTHRDRQRKTRERLEAHKGGIADRLPLSEIDPYWRLRAWRGWTEDVFTKPGVTDYSILLDGRIDVTRITPATWAHHWEHEVDPARMPRHYAIGAADFAQRRHSLSPGNSLDALHAANLLDAERFVTADGDFADVLPDLDSVLHPRCKIIELDPTVSIVSQVQRSIARRGT
jgi:hypothetical protein